MKLLFYMPILLAAVVLSSGCLGGEAEEITTTIAKPPTTTTEALPVSTSTIATTTLASTITITSTVEPAVKEISCDSICGENGYGGGYCRRTVMECRLNSEIYNRGGSRYCPRVKDNTCCCFNEGERDHKNATTHYVYNLKK